MDKSTSLFFLLVGLTAFLPSLLACPTCPSVTPPPPPASTPCPPPPKHKPVPVSSPPPPKPVPVLSPPPPKPVPVSSPPPPKPVPVPCPPTPPKVHEKCPLDTLKLGACVDVLGGLVHNVIGKSASGACCPLVAGVSGLDAALCLCTTIKAKLLNINIFLPIALELLEGCGKSIPEGFQCP